MQVNLYITILLDCMIVRSGWEDGRKENAEVARLIDADKFKQQIAAVTIMNNYDAGFANKLCELVENQPTAYDVDKVVEELQDLTIEFEAFGMCNDYVEISHAIETVRAGGKE